MEVQIQELIDKIKVEGVARAEQTAEEILAAARQKASVLLNDAKSEAEKISADAKAEANKFQVTGKQAVVQAGRDLLLNVRNQLSRLFAALIEGEVGNVLNSYFLENALTKLVNKWAETGNQDLKVLLSEADLKKLEDFFKLKFKEKLKKGVEVKAVPGIAYGFKIGEKDGSSFYDLTDEGIAESLKPYLNEKLAACMDEALK